MSYYHIGVVMSYHHITFNHISDTLAIFIHNQFHSVTMVIKEHYQTFDQILSHSTPSRDISWHHVTCNSITLSFQLRFCSFICYFRILNSLRIWTQKKNLELESSTLLPAISTNIRSHHSTSHHIKSLERAPRVQHLHLRDERGSQVL